MEFNELLFKQEIEKLLAKHTGPNGMSSNDLRNFRFEAWVYANHLYGDQSIDIMPFYNQERKCYNMTIYVSPYKDKFWSYFDYHYEVPAASEIPPH